MPRHKQVSVNGIDVDEGIAELLEMLWENGISTSFSCQGDPGTGMIVFPNVPDAVRFIEETLVLTGFYGCFYCRLTMNLMAPDRSDLWQRVRAAVEWPFEFTETWTAAWRGEVINCEQALDGAESRRKAVDA